MKYIIKYQTIIFYVVVILLVIVKPAMIFLLGGLAVVFFGIKAIVIQKKIESKGIECSGTILDYNVNSRGTKIPLIEFITSTGETIKKRPAIYSATDLNKIRSYKSKIDQSISITYDPDNPEKFIVSNDSDFNYVAFVFMILVGAAFIFVSIINFNDLKIH